MKNYFYVICILVLSLMLAFNFGCAQKKTQTQEPTKKAQESSKDKNEKQDKKAEENKDKDGDKNEEKAKKEPTPMQKYEQKYAKLPKQHTVEKGECLWWIAEDKSTYNDPFMWPLIYKANKDKIDDPDLIYPNQDFSIPREFSLNKLKQSRKSAGAPSPYQPPKDANISAKLRNKLGWDF